MSFGGVTFFGDRVQGEGRSFFRIFMRAVFLILGLMGLASFGAEVKKEMPMTPGGVWRAHDMNRPRPLVVSPAGMSTQEKAGAAPSDAVVLFDGKDLSKWKSDPKKDQAGGDDKPTWKVAGGYMEVAPKTAGIRTREKFKGDWQLHFEWATPVEVKGNGQGRGNSGLFIGGFPEIQVLDSHENDTYPDGQAAGLYGQYPPMVNASRKPGEWQTYDVLFERSKAGQKARLTVIHNGVVVHYLREFDSAVQEGDIALQDHHNPMRFRNIWMRPLRVDSDKVGTKPEVKKEVKKEMKKEVKAKVEEKAVGAMKEVVIKTMTAQMRYDVEGFTVRPGERVKLRFENGDDLPHNIVFCQPGTDTVAMALKQMENPEAALKRDWVPEDKAIWLHSKMLNPHEEQTLEFAAPEKAGDYPFVCTFPGHALSMKGVMKVLPMGGGLKDLRFAMYLGAWSKLPDFNTLKPHREGVIEDNLIQIKLDDYKNEFGVVYTGGLEVPRTGSYRFYIAGDDGVRLKIDGKTVVEHDGIHPAGEIKEGSVKLDAGRHELRLEYFQKAGDLAVFAAWKGASFDVTPLSAWKPEGWESGAKAKKKADYPPMPLVVKEEPVMYRNFIAGAGNRAIAVGYPGGVSLAWSAEQMNLALVWRGAFIDASMHWNSRGGGYQTPLGYDAVQPAYGQPFAVLSAPDAVWPTVQERAAGYVWRGYRLDEKRHPVFQYEWNGVKVEERYEVAVGKLKRVLTLAGAVPEGTFLRLGAGKVTAQEGGFVVAGPTLNLGKLAYENRCVIRAKGAVVAGESLVVPVTGAGVIEVGYSWVK
jgi:plastocyanin